VPHPTRPVVPPGGSSFSVAIFEIAGGFAQAFCVARLSQNNANKSGDLHLHLQLRIICNNDLTSSSKAWQGSAMEFGPLWRAFGCREDVVWLTGIVSLVAARRQIGAVMTNETAGMFALEKFTR
jgi:hypothetical protein